MSATPIQPRMTPAEARPPPPRAGSRSMSRRALEPRKIARTDAISGIAKILGQGGGYPDAPRRPQLEA